ncbi:mRNA-degrading endonuclease [Candidatus Kaiserbacteria bacterium RIFCSPHIGHO2_02_FULL_55_17]|uniref:mRNA-degrading endonuclease n=1 Tax=Candidatus Kaiserbacteria bacterium RIFCSPHIGHO2_02_FULL_55_17 TaxID=1798496 RepID=A0A1F6DTM8_9BACT|nr:MAG: mRNA-degrading endonuclease [Candidatus Kaiserbacteria bacterium RIFCSPHIGHO2_02_FULL_55_17]
MTWLDFNPVRGHEQRGRRPALVLSSGKYNAKSGLALVCPITSQVKGYPFEVGFKIKAVQGVILADQIRGVDWSQRNAEKIGDVSEAVVVKVQHYVKKLVLE